MQTANERKILSMVPLFAFLLLESTGLSNPIPDVAPRLHPRQSSGSSSVYQTRFPGVTWDNSAWMLTTTHLDQGHYQSRMSIANGYHGISVAALGPFFEVEATVDGDDINGWPLFDRRQTFATVAGFWDSQPRTNGTNYPWLSQYGWDSVISGIPHWSGIVLELGDGAVLDASTNSSMISNFSSTLDMKNGLMNWAFTWSPHANTSFDISFQMFAHKLYVNQGFVTMNITAHHQQNVTVVNVLNGDCAVRTTFANKAIDGGLIYTSVRPNGIDNVTAFVYAGLNSTGTTLTDIGEVSGNHSYLGNNESSIAQAYNLTLIAGQAVTLTKYVGIASSDGFPNPQVVAKNAAMQAMTTGYDTSLQSHAAEWAILFPTSSVDDYSFPENGSLPNDPYLIESAITAITNPYHILQNVLTENAVSAAGNASINSNSIMVSGLGSGSYAGQIFWDAEIWMQPGIVAAHPYAGRGIASYRSTRLPQAMKNVKTAYQSSKKHTNFSSNAAVYSWTSGRYSNCTATGPCFDYEYHINGDIGKEMVNYWVVTGDTNYFQSELFPVYDSVATLYSDILQQNGSAYVLTNMTDPDEYTNNVDNGAYTMALINITLANANNFRAMFGMTPNATWTTQAQNVLVSRDTSADITLEYTGMNGSVLVKQADVVLNTYPLRYSSHNYSSADSLSDLDYYAAKQSPDGPGMTYAIFSIVASEVSPSGCASYTYQQYAEQPYARAPWFQFSEQLIDDFTTNGGTHPAFPFLTGHGGANQVTLFGYLGLRLVPDGMLHVSPSLPPQIPQLRYRTFFWQGWPISAFSNQTHTTLSVANVSSTAGAVPNATLASTGIPVLAGALDNYTSYTLPMNGTVVIPNRQFSLNQTVAGNIAQCLPATSPDDFAPGQFPMAAVDGAVSTKWQPAFANKNASITVSLPAGLKVRALSFDWAQAPPVNYSVIFHNGTINSAGTGPGALVVHSEKHVNISQPYSTKGAAKIVPYHSNTTTVTLGGDIYTANFATLNIWGTQLNGPGPKEVTNGTGATVAEWSIIVDNGSTSYDALSRRDAAAGKTTPRRFEASSYLAQLGRTAEGRR